MKDERKPNIKVLARKIVKAEKELQLGKNVKENQHKIEDIMSSLSLEEAIRLDAYISEKKLLTK